MDVFKLLKIKDHMIRIFSNGDVSGNATHFTLEQLAPAQAVGFLMANGWDVHSLSSSYDKLYVCRKES